MTLILLKTPIKEKGFIKDKVIDSITLRKPTARDLYGLNFSPANINESVVKLISRLSGRSLDSIEQLEWDDLMNLQDKVNKFFERGEY